MKTSRRTDAVQCRWSTVVLRKKKVAIWSLTSSRRKIGEDVKRERESEAILFDKRANDHNHRLVRLILPLSGCAACRRLLSGMKIG